MKSYTSIDIFDIHEKGVVVKYRGENTHPNKLVAYRVFVTLLNKTFDYEYRYKYLVGNGKHFKTWRGAKGYIRSIFRHFTPSSFWR